jgi:hypothetical protein
MSEQAILFSTWAGIFVTGFIIIAIRKRALRIPSKGLSAPRAPRAPREIELAKEVRLIRQTLQVIQISIAILGFYIVAFWPKTYNIIDITP